jgi:hypothetical protein
VNWVDPLGLRVGQEGDIAQSVGNFVQGCFDAIGRAKNAIDRLLNKSQKETYYHYSTYPPSRFAGGMWRQSYGTTIPGLNAQSASQGLGIPPPTLQYPVTVDPSVTRVKDEGYVDRTPGRYTGGLPQVSFPDGTPPGSVGTPTPVRQ